MTSIKSDMINTISQSKTWKKIVSEADKAHPKLAGVKINSELLCLKNRTSCNAGTYNLTLLDMNGNILVDPEIATKGFDTNGVPCDSYGSDSSCAFRFSLNWTAICPSGASSCLDPQIKVKITATSSNQSFINSKTLSPFELLVDTEKESDPVIKKAVIFTNSPIHYASEAPVDFDPSTYIFSESKINFTIGVSPENPKSINGGLLTASKNLITYTPSNKFYGFDQFQYTVTNPLNGKTYLASAWVWVMTPYTWTGLGSNSNTSTLKNFCGKVKSGACDGTSFPASDRHFIFNGSCTNCNASLNTDAGSIEMAKDYMGTVQQTLNVSIGNLYSSSWMKLPLYNQVGGTFEGKNNTLLVDLTNVPYYTVDDMTFFLSGGTFNAPSVLRVVGPFKISNNKSFNHNNGLVNLFKIYGTNSKVEAPNVHFYDLQFDNLVVNYGTHHEFRITDNFTVENNLIHSPRGGEDSLRSTSGAKISVKGNVYVEGFGGTYGYVDQAIVSLDGDGDQGIYGSPVTDAQKASKSAGSLVGFLPKVQINKTSGKVTIKNWIGLGGFEVLQTPAALGLAAIESSSTLVFGLDCLTINIKPGDFHYNDVYFLPGGSCYVDVFIDDANFNIDGNMYHYTNGASHVFGRSDGSTKINLLGDLYIAGGFDVSRLYAAATINMTGSKSSTIWGTPTSIFQSHIHINKSSEASVKISGGFGTARDLKVISGSLTVDPDVTVRIPCLGWNYFTATFDTPGVQFHSMTIDHGFRAASDILLDGDLNIGTNNGGKYALSLGGPGKFILDGNLNLGSHLPYGGGQKIVFSGNKDTNINFTASPFSIKNLGSSEFIINKNSQSAKVSYNSGGVKIANLSVTKGILDMISYSTIQTDTASSDAGTTINKNGNNLNATKTSYSGVVNK